MNKKQWDTIKYFSPNENWGNPNNMAYELLILLDNLREYLRKPIIIHCGYEDRQNDSYHCKGMAVDCHCPEIALLDFYTEASRFPFQGIGVYPWWNNPGLHLDIRPEDNKGYRSLWGSTSNQIYVPLTSSFLKNI